MLTITLSDLIARDDADLARWAIDWLGIDVPTEWEDDLDDDERDWLVDSGIVEEVAADVECTSAETWQSDWRSDTGGSWPCYTLVVSADGMETIALTGWHFVGPMGPDGNRRHECWVTEDSDGAYSGLPSVSDWSLDDGANVGGSEIIPCWSHDGCLYTLDRDALTDSIEDAAGDADHGDAPTWEDVEASDMDRDDAVYIIRENAIEEVYMLTGGIAGRDKAWSHDLAGDETWETREEALTDLAGRSQDGETHDSEAVHLALSRIAMCEYDPPEGLDMGVDDFGLYVEPYDSEERYHLSDDELTRLLDGGWDAVIEDIAESLGARACLAALREQQEALDEIVDETDPLVSIEDSVATGNCRYGTERFAADLRAHLHAAGEIGAVRASIILALRDDAYTRRACRMAARRGH